MTVLPQLVTSFEKAMEDVHEEARHWGRALRVLSCTPILIDSASYVLREMPSLLSVLTACGLVFLP